LLPMRCSHRNFLLSTRENPLKTQAINRFAEKPCFSVFVTAD
jgi:hypothetical protein